MPTGRYARLFSEEVERAPSWRGMVIRRGRKPDSQCTWKYAWHLESKESKLAGQLSRPGKALSRQSRKRLSLLTRRESEVLTWLVRGATNRQIGAALRVSSRTIEKHVERILTKLAVKNRTLAALLASQADSQNAPT